MNSQAIEKCMMPSDVQDLVGIEEKNDVHLEVRPSRLAGVVELSGAKNSALKLLAAALHTDDTVILERFPTRILDARIQLGMLRRLGKSVILRDDAVEVSGPISTTSLKWEYRSVRTTLLMLGALVARYGQSAVPLPGGCDLGERKYDLHVAVLTALGAKVAQDGPTLCASAPRGLIGNDIYLPIRSTGATENALLCGIRAKGVTRVWNPHIRPEILDLVRLLRSMGCEIHIHGQEHIEIHGSSEIGGARHRVIPDNVEAVTWVTAAAITGGDIQINQFPYQDLEVPLAFLRESGVRLFRDGDSLIARGERCFPIDIATGPYPGINSDMQPLFAVLGACARGESRIIDLRFPDRYAYVDGLTELGAHFGRDGNLLRIFGGTELVGASIRAPDLRSGAALALAGLVAKGSTQILDARQILRGYDRFTDKLTGLGAQVVEAC